MRIISRSSIQQYQFCPRSFYHKYFDPAGGPGIEPIERPEYYALGISFHEAGERLLKGEGGLAAGAAAVEDAKQRGLSPRWQDWLMGAALAWERTEAEGFFSTYDILSVEEETYVPITRDVALYGRADAVLVERDTGATYVWNWKTTSDLRDWNKKFFFDIQSWTEAISVASKVERPVDGVIYGGVWKGPMYKGFTTSRLVGGYKGKTGRGETIWSPNRGKGLTEKFLASGEVFPSGAGILGWVSWLPESLIKSHFAVSAPQACDEAAIDGWVRGISRRESDIDHISQSGSNDDILDFFVQHAGDGCESCPYLDICSGRSTSESLLRDGRMKPRDESHLNPPEDLE